MTISRVVLLALIGGSLALTGGNAVTAPKLPEPTEGPFDKDLLKAAAGYKAWGRVDDEMRWSPELCRLPNPGRAYLSASKDADTHGKKLYSLLTSQRRDYLALAEKKTVPVGFAIVKESWVPEEITDPKEKAVAARIDRTKVIRTPGLDRTEGGRTFASLGDHFYPYAVKGDKVYKATKQADLFIMLKLDPKTEGTDAGWVYGTVTPDGKKVTAAGKIESCMKCHQDAKTDRLFGLSR
jgi:hypothetical protein